MSYIIFTDLDETLLKSDKTISDFTRNFFKEFTAMGNKLVLSSGRSLKSVMKVKNDLMLNFPGVYLCASNGAIAYDCEQDCILFESRMKMEHVEAVWNMAKERDIYVQTYTDTELVFKKHCPENDLYLKYCPLPVKISDTPWLDIDKPPCKVLAISLDNKKKLSLFAQDIIASFPELDSFFSSDYYLEIIDRKAGKGNGLIHLCKTLGIPLENAYAFGDEENDITMLKAAGHGIAMKNSNPELFKICDEITEFDNNSDGLARFMLKQKNIMQNC